MEHPLYVAIVWHMHQPYYRDIRTGEIVLPWVRLHAAKDYLHMAEVLERHPDVHVTINMVPSLSDQIVAWASGKDQDQLVTLAGQSSWTLDEKRLILNLCYSIHRDNIIRRYPRYSELLDRRSQALADPNVFSAHDYRDLIAWFNLAWIDPNWLERDKRLARLVSKGRNFTLADLREIHDKQREIAAAVFPLYHKLAGTGQLEISASPYYHPILPLLLDTGSARRPSPGLPLPTLNYRAPEDAAAQLQAAVDSHERNFGVSPRGLWPSEGAVSFELLPYVTAAGFQGLASDEEILARSLGRRLTRDGNGMMQQPHVLYKPYRVMSGPDLGPAIVFRDHELSDRIGFLYTRFPGRQAAEDMTYRLLEIRNRLNDPQHPYLVSIILDGENCWEFYEHNGDVFLDALYGALAERSKRNELRAVTVSEYLSEHGTGGTLARLATGSWIGGDLTTWIGDPEHNRAWEALARTRAHLVQRVDGAGHWWASAIEARPETGDATTSEGPGPATISAAWRALASAEGSDWFWWYSHRNSSDQDPMFDRLFRDNLAAVYEALGDPVPGWLDQPIANGAAASTGHTAAGYITPQLRGEPYPGEDWALAAALQPAEASTGTMQRAGGLIERLFLGHDRQSLYLRLDLRDQLDSFTVAIYFGARSGECANSRPAARDANPGATSFALGWQIELPPGQSVPFLFRAAGNEQWQSVGPLAAATGPHVLEVALPLAVLGLEVGQELSLVITLARHGTVVAQLPEAGMQAFELQHFGLGG